MQEMKSRLNDDDVLVDYVKALLSESPSAKHQLIGAIQEHPFRTESSSGDSFYQGKPINEDDWRNWSPLFEATNISFE